MTQEASTENKDLIKNAKTSKHKEIYKLMEKNSAYRVGVGARAPSAEALSFFVEVVINLSVKTGEVDLYRLEKTMSCLRTLQESGYALAFEDGNCISCEKKRVEDLEKECETLRSLLKTLI